MGKNPMNHLSFSPCLNELQMKQEKLYTLDNALIHAIHAILEWSGLSIVNHD